MESPLDRLHRPDWQARAACLAHDDPDRFYTGTDADTVIATWCDGCPVRTECLLDALDRGDTEGVWGGTTPDQRRDIARLAQEVT